MLLILLITILKFEPRAEATGKLCAKGNFHELSQAKHISKLLAIFWTVPKRYHKNILKSFLSLLNLKLIVLF